jgi:hypothetical protein
MNAHIAALAALQAALPTLPESKKDFASSLLTQSRGRGLSEKQMYWVRKLAEPTPTAPVAAIEVGSFEGVIALFRTAQRHLKFPKVRLRLENGSPIVLAVAGANARRPGTVNVTDGRPFGENIWYGRVEADGRWEASRSVDAETATSLTALLTAFAAEPAKVAAAFGHLTGNCCFCAKTLTDERSTSVGYGPVCAEKFGLAWG